MAVRIMSIAIRRCHSCLRDNTTTRGFVIEIELFGFLAEVVLTRKR